MKAEFEVTENSRKKLEEEEEMMRDRMKKVKEAAELARKVRE